MTGNLSFQVGEEQVWLTDFNNKGEYMEKRAQVHTMYNDYAYDLVITIQSSINETAGTKAPAVDTSNQHN